MYYTSTKGDFEHTFSQAITNGLAPDGGLYVPQRYPTLDILELKGLSVAEIAFRILSPYLVSDVLESSLEEICAESFNFDIPVTSLGDNWLLELYHGPTGAFKDVGARFLASCLTRLDKELNIVVATSGDTGSAVAAGFHGIENTNVIILYPKGRISAFQENQLTYFGDNIHAVRVNGDFDACQSLAKQCFKDRELQDLGISSANSINIGRLLPQSVYYAHSSLKVFEGHPVNIAVPTGNMGNVIACMWAKQMGFPIGAITICQNSNTPLHEYFKTGIFQPRESIQTLANAMDVGNPSNFWRFPHLVNSGFDVRSLSTTTMDDTSILSTIREVYHKTGRVIDPHTATAMGADADLYVATAHPYKFKEIIHQAIGIDIPVPTQLNRYLEVKSPQTDINLEFQALKDYIFDIQH
ncbi:MAG: threonine synthase [Candidatus Kariarchaeaceae archaeon]|jgi:threonine synthase